MSKTTLAVLLLVTGFFMYYLLATVFGWWALLITIPLACLVGYVSGKLMSSRE